MKKDDNNRTGHNFKTIEDADGSTVLLFDSSRPEDCCRFAIEAGISRISLYPGVYLADDLVPILPLNGVLDGLLLGVRLRYKDLAQFHGLKILSLPDNGIDTVDLSNFRSLRTLACELTPRIGGFEACEDLRVLSLNNLKVKTKDLSGLPGSTSVEKLSINATNVESLMGIERFTKLKRFEIYAARKLKTIASLPRLRNSLEEIEFEKCKLISDYATLGELRVLKKLILTDSGQMESIKFIGSLRKLEFLSFWGTNVVDGDLSYCAGIKYVGFENRRHYSHKAEYFKKASPI